ncbi:MAG: hypothetical protein GF398_05685 [Chitinivibrionales bacterium]|nr:hypothetical protein [Chitinivibrionales bacterium]
MPGERQSRFRHGGCLLEAQVEWFVNERAFGNTDLFGKCAKADAADVTKNFVSRFELCDRAANLLDNSGDIVSGNPDFRLEQSGPHPSDEWFPCNRKRLLKLTELACTLTSTMLSCASGISTSLIVHASGEKVPL